MYKLLSCLIFACVFPFHSVVAQQADYYDLAYQADSLLQINRNSQSAKLYDKAFEFPPSRLVQYDLYEAACAHARIGDTIRALSYLEMLVVKTNYHSAEDLKNDQDLTNLSSTARWKKILQRAVKNNQVFEAGLNRPLKDSLESMFDRDQQHRIKLNGLIKSYGVASTQVGHLEEEISTDDALNMDFISKVIDK